MITVGLTGGIACGKSSVAAILRGSGVPVLDLDQTSREVVAPGTAGFAEIQARWPSVVRDGSIDRKALGALVVGDEGARRELEHIVHPRVWEASERWIAARESEGHPAAVVEAALMVETRSYRRYDKLIVVSAAGPVQRARLAAREGFDAATVERWIATQLPLAEKEAVASTVIRNDGDLTALASQTLTAWGQLLGV